MADEVKIDLSAFENSSAKSDSIDLSDFKKAEPTPKQPKKVKDDWEGSAGVVKPTPMESMEIERTRKKPSDGTTGMVKPIIRNLKEEEKAFDNVTQRRLKSKGVSFKLGDANYKKEREAVLKDVYDGTLVATENNKGEKDYGRSVGFFGSILDGATESIKSEVDAAKINTISDPTELSVYIEQEAANRADVEPVRNKYGSMIGGLPKIIALQSVGAAATAEAGGIGGPALVGADALWVGTSIKRQELYWEKKKELVDKGMDEGEAGVQAAQAAMQDAPLAAVPDAAVQYAMASMSGAETPGLTASRNAFKNYIAKPTKIAIMGATQPVAEYGIKKAQGYDVNFQDAVANSGKGFTDFYLQDLAFNVGMHPLKFAKTMVSSAKEYLSNLPKEILESTASKYGDDGKKVVDGLKTYSNARQKVAGHVPQDIIHNVAGLQEAIDNGSAKIQAMKAPDVNTPDAIIKTEEQKLSELKKRQNTIIETGKGDIHEVDDKTGLPIEEEEPTEEVKATEERNIEFGTAFKMQDATAETTVGKNKDNWGESQVWRERIENAGDILRELSSRGQNPDANYLLEKVQKIKDWIERNKKYPSEKISNEIKTIEDFKNSKLKNTNALDGYDYLNRFHSDILNKAKNEYEAIDTYTKEQKLARDLVIDLMNNNIESVESKLNDIENIANKVKNEGKLEIVKDIQLGNKSETKPTEVKYTQTEEGKTADQEAKDMGFDGVDHAINSVNKELGTDYKTIQEIPKEDLQKVSDNKKELTAHKDSLLQTVKGTEYEDKARSAGLRTDTTTGTTGEVSGEPTGKAEPIEGATPTEQTTFDEYRKSRNADPERFKREYESERYAEFGETEEEYLRRKFCK